MVDTSVDRLYERFITTKTSYGRRDEWLIDTDLFFRGAQWEDDEPEEGDELVRVTWNYTRLAVLKQVAYLTGHVPRADVLSATADAAAARRESFVRALLTHRSLWGTWSRAVEMDASEYGYGIVQVLWDPSPGGKTSSKVPDIEGKQKTVYTKVPFTFTAIDPGHFYPRYNTFDKPNDFLCVFRHQPERLIEDVEAKYDVKLQATALLEGTEGTCDLVEYWDTEEYVLFALTSRTESSRDGGAVAEIETVTEVQREKHGYGIIPFFVLQNIAVPHKTPMEEGSISDVELVRESNKHLNLLQSMIATEILTRMQPPVVYKSDHHTMDAADIRMGAGEVLPIGADEDIDPVDWKGIPATVAKHADDTLHSLVDLGGLPRTDLGAGDSVGASTSGIGMRLAYSNLELALVLKIPRRVEVLESVLSFCLRVLEGKLGPQDTVSFSVRPKAPVSGGKAETISVDNLSKDDIGGRDECNVEYPDALPRDSVQQEQHIVYLFNAKLISHRTALERISGIADPDAEIELLKKELQDAVLNPEAVAATTAAEPPEEEAGAPPAQPVMGAGMPPGMPPGILGQGSLDQLRFNTAPPVPATPEMPTGRNTPYLKRQPNLNINQQFGGRPGVYGGPPIEEMY